MAARLRLPTARNWTSARCRPRANRTSRSDLPPGRSSAWNSLGIVRSYQMDGFAADVLTVDKPSDRILVPPPRRLREPLGRGLLQSAGITNSGAARAGP